ncbi:MAG: efflux RND transporter periplasmic adaptor subunit [Patescibacteria group bacterium]
MNTIKKILQKIKAMSKKTKIILGVILIIIILILIPILKPKKPVYELGKVVRSNVIQEISANGTVESTNEIDLKFKTTGTVEKIFTKVGENVKKGAYLVSLDSGTIYSQYLQVQASYNQAKAKLDQLLAGVSNEEIKVGEQVLENAAKSLDDARDKAENDLNQDYGSGLVYLIGASSKCNKSITDLQDIEKLYFNGVNSFSRTFIEKQGQAEDAFLGVMSTKGAQELIEIATDNPTQENIDLALSKMWIALQKTSDVLDYVKTSFSDSSFGQTVSVTDKTTITTDSGEINSVFLNVSNSQTEIANQKITNQINVNSAENTYNKAKVDLDKLIAKPREVDIAVYQTDVDRYKANLTEYTTKLRDASIIAPFDGVVAKIDAKIGETINTEKIIVTLINPKGLQIKIDVPETDISKVSPDDLVEITLDAISEETYSGQIIEMDSGKTIIDGVVYYKIKILFEGDNTKIKSGMSGDATIQTEEKDNVLNVPQRAVISKNGKKYVRILDGKNVVEKEVVTGLRGSQGEVEIISGLIEGEEIITYMKNGK